MTDSGEVCPQNGSKNPGAKAGRDMLIGCNHDQKCGDRPTASRSLSGLMAHCICLCVCTGCESKAAREFLP
jgi:hypothetical protein